MYLLRGNLPVVSVVAAYAFGRVLTMAMVTPNGAGIVETGSAAVLVALGARGDVAAASVILFSAMTYLLETLVGAVLLAGWRIRRSARRRAAVERARPPCSARAGSADEPN